MTSPSALSGPLEQPMCQRERASVSLFARPSSFLLPRPSEGSESAQSQPFSRWENAPSGPRTPPR